MKPWFKRQLWLNRASPNEIERKSIRLGKLLADGSPLMLHEVSAAGNIYLRGAPNSGKSAMLAYLVEHRVSLGGCIVRFIDLRDQNSMELLAAILAGAARSGTRVRYFTLEPGQATHTFNVFVLPFFRRLTPMQKALLIGAALGSTHGLVDYGPQHFGGNALELYVVVFEHFEVESFVDFVDKMRLVQATPSAYGLSKDGVKAASQAFNDVKRLARIPALNTPRSTIDLAPSEPQAEYWTFPASFDLAGAISRLVLFASFAATKTSEANAEGELRTWVVLDEFQRALGNRLELLFQQGRKRISLLVSNQGLSDLVTKNKDYRSTVKTCCRVHWTFNAADEEEQQFMADYSGTVARRRQTTTHTKGLFGPTEVSTTFGEYFTTRYGFNDVSIASAQPGLSIIRCTEDYGFIQYGGFPQVLVSEFHITREEYERRSRMPWPDGDDDTITPGNPAPVGPPTPPAPPHANIINPGEQRESRRSRRRRKPL